MANETKLVEVPKKKGRPRARLSFNDEKHDFVEVEKGKLSRKYEHPVDLIEVEKIETFVPYPDKIKVGIRENPYKDSRKKLIEISIGIELVTMFFSTPPNKLGFSFSKENPKIWVLRESDKGRRMNQKSKNCGLVNIIIKDTHPLFKMKPMPRTEVKFDFYNNGLYIYL